MRTTLVLTVTGSLLNERAGRPPDNNVLIFAMKAAASGDRDRFERVMAKIPDGEDHATHYVRALADLIWTELGHRELLKTNPKKSKRPHSFRAWHKEIRLMLELLLGPRDGDDWEFDPPPHPGWTYWTPGRDDAFHREAVRLGLDREAVERLRALARSDPRS